jgi:hypothetical protein
VVRTGLLSLIPSVLVAAAVVGILSVLPEVPAEPEPKLGTDSGIAGVVLFFLLVVVGPVAETLVMSAILWCLSWITTRPVPLAVLSATLWAVLHSLVALPWGLVIAWPFYVFSRAYLAWRPLGWWQAFGVAASVHGFQNFLPGLAVMIVVELA